MTKTFITAGAGSGKTYRITTDVAKMVNDENIRLKPDQIIMTTFTKAAAQELREKAKNELVKLGLHDEAQQMEHALIGTVHSVANSFLTKYWYLLGITPDAAAMDEDEVSVYRDHSLKGLLSKEERSFLFKYADTYEPKFGREDPKPGINYEFWKKDLCQVLDYIKWYDISDDQLTKSLDTTQSIIDCLQPRPTESLKELLTDNFYQEVDDFFRLRNGALTKNQQAARDFYYSLNDYNDVTPELVEAFLKHKKLEITSEGTRYKLDGHATQKVSNYLVGTTLYTTENSKNHRKYAEIIFSLTKRWQKEYRQYKDEHHLIDFNDMEELFLKLLGMDEVKQDIQSRFKWLFVDEFQDSNPMQVLIFEALSKLLNTVYVGDKKQAIYGFRGSDTELTTAVADSISDKAPLKHSYRSIEPLVNFSNTLFLNIFSNMPKDDVRLTMPKEKDKGNRDIVEKPLRLWPYEKDEELALQIQQLILREGIKSSDIAVLAKTNANLDKLADELRKLKVPVCREATDIKDSRAGRLLKALLTLVNSPSNQLARAEVAYLASPGFNITKIIEHRLDHLADKESSAISYLNEIPVLKRLNQLQQFRSDEQAEYSMNLMGYQSISALVESLVIELDLYALVQSWENARTEEANLQVFIELARKYEDISTKLAKPATVTGFIDFFTNQPQKGALNDEGVRLFTYHKSKGLEWKVVILMSLDDDAADETDIAMQSMLGCHWHREEQPNPKNFYPPMTISLVRNIYGIKNEIKSAITARLQKHPLWDTVRNHKIDEAARLLYVGVTRARNILILAAIKNDGVLNFNWFRSVGINNMNLQYDSQTKMDPLNIGISFDVETVDPDNLQTWPDQRLNKVHQLAHDPASLDDMLFIAPSKAGKTPHDIVIINDKENRMEVRYKGDEDALMGDFIHQVFCCCDDDISVKQIEELRDSYGFTKKNIHEPERIRDAWNYLVDTLEKKYGKAIKRHHEKPFRHQDENGHIVSGYIDLVWETEDGYVVVDYKTCPGGYELVFKPGSEHYVGSHGDQLDCYQRALEAEGRKPVIARIIYYPVTRYVVEVH